MRDDYSSENWKSAWRPNAKPNPDDATVRLRRVLLDEEMTAVFPDSESVNRALRIFLRREEKQPTSADSPPAQSA